MTALDDSDTAAGARSPGPTYQDLLDADTHPVPAVLRLESPRYLGSADIPIERYISREWHRREVDQLWSRVWQFACREDHIPEPGDYIVYDIAELSFLVVRQSDGSIKAFPNACLHRGRQLKEYDGHCSEIRCAFHGFAWDLSGNLADVPAAWDFPHVDQRPDDFTLPECSVDTWAGFVFINPDPNAAPLADHLGEIVEQFEVWDLGNRCVEAHVSRIINANWKIAQEAFCEAYHVNATHPQILTYLGDVNSQVDVWDRCSRVITPGGTISPLLDYEVSEQDMLRGMLDVRVDQDAPLTLEEGQTARAVAAEMSRDRWRPIAGDMVDQMSDAEMMDSIDYTVFPNMHPWGAFNRITYRFRPNGDDHRSSIMEVFFLSPFTGERPPPAKEHRLGVDDPWTDAPELGMLAKVFEQDVFNMAKVQKGLETTRGSPVPRSPTTRSRRSAGSTLCSANGSAVPPTPPSASGPGHEGHRSSVHRRAARAGRRREHQGDPRRPVGHLRHRRALDLRRTARMRPAAVRLGGRPDHREPSGPLAVAGRLNPTGSAGGECFEQLPRWAAAVGVVDRQLDLGRAGIDVLGGALDDVVAVTPRDEGVDESIAPPLGPVGVGRIPAPSTAAGTPPSGR